MLRAALVSAALLVPTLAWADTTLVYDEGGRSNAMRIAAGKVRLDSPDGSGWMVFDAATRTLTLVEPGRGEYLILDEAGLGAVQQTLEGAMTQLEAQLAGLPPEARRQMLQMMGGQMPGEGAGEKARVEDTGQSGEAAGHACRFSRVLVGGEEQGRACLASAEALGLPPDDAATVRQWQGFARSMAERASRFVSLDLNVLGEGDQVPLIYEHPGTRTRGVLTEIRQGPVDPALFLVPEGYRQRQLGLPPM
jgi:hypothetical protein